MHLSLLGVVFFSHVAVGSFINSNDNQKYNDLDEAASLYLGESYEEIEDANVLSKQNDEKTSSDMLRAFNAPNRETQKLLDDIEKRNAEMDAFILLADGDKTDLLRELHNFKRTVTIADPMCAMYYECSNITNRNYVDGLEYRTINGMCNNLGNFSWGMAGVQHRRLLPNAYDNGEWIPRSTSVTGTILAPVSLPSARKVSNTVHSTPSNKAENTQNLSIALFYFMQFIGHDVILTPLGSLARYGNCCSLIDDFCMPIRITEPDKYFPLNYCMDAQRSFSVYPCNTGSRFQNQLNQVTSYIDGSMIYGYSLEGMYTLRTNVSGYLKQSTAQFLPQSASPETQACNNVLNPGICFQTGDQRTNVHPGLTTFHTVFVREHNRIAKYLSRINPSWTDERIFQEVRKIVGAVLQHLVYDEMLPLVLDSSIIASYGVSQIYQYNKSLPASVFQSFSLAYRYHNMMPDSLRMSDIVGSTVSNIASFKQESAYMSPQYLFMNNYRGINQIALGLAANKCPFAYRQMNDAARNKLFLDSNLRSFDLATLNIQRGREWGTPAYTQFRSLCGVNNVTTWTDLKSTHSDDAIAALQKVYLSPNDIDLWTGMVTENPIGNSLTGAVQSCLVAKQFALLKHGDRFWYEATFTPSNLVHLSLQWT